MLSGTNPDMANSKEDPMEGIVPFSCPDCRDILDGIADGLFCHACQRPYAVLGGVPLLFPKLIGDLQRSEIDYWDGRVDKEFGSGLDTWYESNYFLVDRWSMYRYAQQLRVLPQDAAILEVGSGTIAKGLFLTLHEGYNRVVMTDIAPAQLVANREFAKTHGVQVDGRYAACEGEHLPFADATFDAVFLHSALHHFASPSIGIRELARCLRPGGLLILGHEPNKRILRLVRLVADGLRLSERYHESTHSEADDEAHGFSLGELSGYLRSVDVHVEEVDRHWYLMGIVHPLPLLLRRVFGRDFEHLELLRVVANFIDSKVRLVPLLNELCFYYSVVGRKTGVVRDDAK